MSTAVPSSATDLAATIRASLTAESAYAVAGPRRGTPDAILVLAGRIARALAMLGWCQRNGIAEGFDQECYNHAGDDVSLYLPWPGFRRGESDYHAAHVVRQEASAVALDLAARCHSNWAACHRSARMLLGRNSHVIAGHRCDDPAAFLLCYTSNGRDAGGTGQTIRVAQRYGVRVDNLFFGDVRRAWESVL
jgi:hypothetical protein